MSKLNNPGCVVVVGGNTGVPDCTFAPEKIIGAILIDRNKIFSQADIENLIVKLQEATLETGQNRILPIFRFEEIADNSEEETISTLGYGSKQVVKEGKYDWTFRLLKGGMCLQKNLRTYNGTNKKVLFIDANNVIYGTQIGEGGFTGFSLDFFYAKPFKANDASNAAIFQVRFALSKPAEFNDRVAFIKMEVDVEDNLRGIIDLELTLKAKEPGKASVSVQTQCDKIDLYDAFSESLASGSLWKVSKNGIPVTINTVAKNDALKAWDISFTGTDAHQITLETPKVLAAANIGGAPENGYEAGTLSVIMPS